MHFFLLSLSFVVLTETKHIESPQKIRNLPYDPFISVTTTGIALGVLTAFKIFETDLAAKRCRWCGPNGFDSNAQIDLRWSNKNLANKLSHIAALGILPAGILSTELWINGQSSEWKRMAEDLGIILEAVAVSEVFGMAIQLATARDRPNHPSGSPPTSFYSDHANIAFALAVSSGTVATMRNYELAPYIWGGGLLIAGTASYLRIAAERHFATDIIAAAVAGSVIGFTLPYFLHRPKDFSLAVIPTDSGLTAMSQWRF